MDLKSELRKSIDSLIERLRLKGLDVDNDLKDELEKIALPVSFARPLPFDPTNPAHRKGNQIGFGFPFITEKHSWPIDSTGNPKQPVVQLDLGQSSNLIGHDFGSGVIQLWANADVLNEDVELELVHIDPIGLSSEPILYFPDCPFWRRELSDGAPESPDLIEWRWDITECRIQLDLDYGIRSPLVEWFFYGFQLPDELCAIRGSRDFTHIKKHPDFFNCIREIQVELIEKSYRRASPQLGGYTYDWGRNSSYSHPIERPDFRASSEDTDILLLSAQWDNGIGVSGVYLKANKDINGAVNFKYDLYERFER
jgi:hypothetical protein